MPWTCCCNPIMCVCKNPTGQTSCLLQPAGEPSLTERLLHTVSFKCFFEFFHWVTQEICAERQKCPIRNSAGQKDCWGANSVVCGVMGRFWFGLVVWSEEADQCGPIAPWFSADSASDLPLCVSLLQMQEVQHPLQAQTRWSSTAANNQC